MTLEELHTRYSGELSVRAITILSRVELFTKPEVLNAMLSGSLVPQRKPRNYGKKTHAELCQWIGVTPKTMTPLPAAYCPHCRKAL